VKVEVEDYRRPWWDTPSSAPKKEWRSTFSNMRASSTLTEPAESAPFRLSLFPGCLLHAEADLKPRKAFKDAVLKTDAAGACGLTLVRCGELVHAALSRDSPMIKRMKDACSGELPQDEDALLGIMRDSLEELNKIKREISKVSNVGSRIVAGIFNQGIEEQRVLVCDSPAAKAVRSTLELCKPSLTHLFGGDESRIEKAMEAAKLGHIRPPLTAPRRLHTFAPPTPRRGGTVRRRPTQRSLLNPTGPQEKPTALPPRGGRAIRSKSFKGGKGVVPGLVSLAQTPRPATIPFRSAPTHEHLEVEGRLRHFLPFWMEVLETPPQLLQAVEGYRPPFMLPPPLACPGAAFWTPLQGANNPFIDAEVAALLEKGAIEEVPSSFISNIFLDT
jgi:hypothetical protein